MFEKLLIANRGAIACRILRTLRELHVKGVAVYAEADAASLHIQQADEAYSLGEGAAAGTYLAVDKILTIAKASGATAIHPGYGFLSENAAFAQACENAGIAFIGPTPQQLRVFGLKHTARALAKQQQIPLLEGSELLDSLDALTEKGPPRKLWLSAETTEQGVNLYIRDNGPGFCMEALGR
ncbi:urea carboxylase, partial [Pseudomonas sp. TNT11]